MSGAFCISVWGVSPTEKVLFRGVQETNSTLNDIVFEHTRTGLFTQSSTRTRLPVSNDNKVQMFPFLKQKLMGTQLELGFYTRQVGSDRSFSIYDFDNNTLTFSRPRTWGDSRSGIQALEYYGGFVYGSGTALNSQTQVFEPALLSADCR